MFAGVPPQPVSFDYSALGWGYLKGLLQSVFLFRSIWQLLGGVLAAKLVFRLYGRGRLARSGVAEIDRIDGQTFENYLEGLFGRLGYGVERTRYEGDYGADLVLVKDGVRTAVQAKRHRGSVGVKAVQEAVAAKAQYACSEAMVVTNSRYTRQALTLAESNRVELWDRERLIRVLLSLQERHGSGAGSAPVSLQPELAAERSAPVAGAATCSTCGKSVSDKVEAFCGSHPNRFNGRIFCYAHQRTAESGIAVSGFPNER